MGFLRRISTTRAPRGIFAVSLLLTIVMLPDCAPRHLQLPVSGSGIRWPMYGRDRYRTNASTDAVIPPLGQAWDYSAGSGFGPCSPAVSDSIVFIATLGGEVRAVNLHSGQETGSVDLGAAIFGTPLLLKDEIVLALSGEEENLVSFNTSKGGFSWKNPAPAIESSPLLDGARIFVAGLDGTLRCFSSLQGEEIWCFRTATADGPNRIRSSPVCDDSLVICGSDRGMVYALGRSSGKIAWRTAVGGAVFAPPVLAGGDRVFISSLDGFVRALNLDGGTLIWERDLGAPVYGGAALGDGRLYAGTSSGEIFALGAGDGRVIWRTKTEGGISAAPLLSGDILYAGDLEKNLYAISVGRGDIVWRYDLPGRVKSSPVVAGEYLLVMTDDRSLIALKGAP